MHKHLGMGGKSLSIFQGTNMKDIQPSTHHLPGTLAGLKEAGSSDSFYWIPSVASFPGVNGVLGDTKGYVYAIQAMIVDDHKNPIEGMVVRLPFGCILMRIHELFNHLYVGKNRYLAMKAHFDCPVGDDGNSES
jgi:hypothetical protein